MFVCVVPGWGEWRVRSGGSRRRQAVAERRMEPQWHCKVRQGTSQYCRDYHARTGGARATVRVGLPAEVAVDVRGVHVPVQRQAAAWPWPGEPFVRPRACPSLHERACVGACALVTTCVSASKRMRGRHARAQARVCLSLRARVCLWVCAGTGGRRTCCPRASTQRSRPAARSRRGMAFAGTWPALWYPES